MANLLEARNLKVNFYLEDKTVDAVEEASLDIAYRQILVLAGASGAGKSVFALCLTKLLPAKAKILAGAALFEGKDLLKLGEDELRKIRGKEIAYMFQEPASYLNPVYTIGEQIAEALILHQKTTKKQARAKAQELLAMVKIKQPERVINNYPHQLSGGMNQRSFIAMAIACQPKLLIADEPTTSLDVTIESQILDLLVELKNKLGFSLLFITHNLSIARRIAERVVVMYRGRVVENAPSKQLFDSPQHPHTKELIGAYRKIGRI